MKLENRYQAGLIVRIRGRWPECFILKNDESYIQGIPDLTILLPGFWAILEVKKSATERYQPNQEYYLDKLGELSFTATIYPENEEEVLNALEQAYRTGESALLPVRKQELVDQLHPREARKGVRDARGRTSRNRPAQLGR